MDEVLVRAVARVFWAVVFAAGCSALLALGAAGLAGAQPNGGDGGAAGFAAASEEFLVGTRLLVGHDGGSVVVSVSEGGPLEAGVDLDLSGAAAEEIGLDPGATAVVEVQVANPEAPVGPLSGATGGSNVVSNVVSTGDQQGDGSFRENRRAMVVNGVEIADSRVLERVATSTGAVTGDDAALGGQYQYGQYQYEGSQYDEDPLEEDQYDQYGLDEYQYDQPQPSEDVAGEAQYDDQYGAREGARSGDDDDAPIRSAAMGPATEVSGGAAPAGGSANASAGTEGASDGSGDDVGSGSAWGNGSRRVPGGLKQLPATGGPSPAGVLFAGLLSIGLVGLAVRGIVR